MRAALVLVLAALVVAPSATVGQMPAAPGANQVEIVRDEWGVPHIRAAREEDGFYGLAYALLEDQAARFYLSILSARGEVAATAVPDQLPPAMRGAYPAVEAMIEEDYKARLWRIHEQAETAVVKLDPQLQRNYQSFLAGVEAFARDHPDRVPAWAPRDLSLADLIAMPHSVLWDMYQGGVPLADCRRGGADIAPVTRRGAVPTPVGYSNEWALMPARTTTGGAVLLTDPHGGVDGRFTHEYALEAGRLHMAGVAQGPLLMLGRNARVGWALTTGAPDTGDCYAIQPRDATSYLYDGQPRTIEMRTITIAVKGRSPVAVPARYVTLNDVVSPVIAERGGRLFVPVTPYLNDLAGMHNTVYRMSLAADTDGIAKAMATGGMFPQNILAADTRGELYYIHGGLVPVRPDPAVDWTRPVSGNSARFAWRGIHPTSDLIEIRSPKAGYLQNNNTDPRFMDVAPPPETRGKPDYLLNDGTPMPVNAFSPRGRRFLDVVTATPRFTEADVRALAVDTVNLHWDGWLKLARAAAPRSRSGTFADDLLKFDGRLDQSSTAALKYVYWREALREALRTSGNAAELPEVVLHGGSPSAGLAATAATAIDTAARTLGERPRGLARTYGDEFRLMTNRGPLPMSGGSLRPRNAQGAPDCAAAPMLCVETLLAVNYAPGRTPGERIAVSGTRIMRLDFYSPSGIRSFNYQNPGISDDPASPHSRDQADKLVSRQQLKPILFDAADLAGHVARRTVLDVKRQ